MEQIARNAIDSDVGALCECRYLLHDGDTKFCATFDSLLKAGGVKAVKLPAKSPNLNSFAERWARSVKEEGGVAEARGRRVTSSIIIRSALDPTRFRWAYAKPRDRSGIRAKTMHVPDSRREADLSCQAPPLSQRAV
jgi:uncharacterized membrane protein